MKTASLTVAPAVRFHLSLNVKDLGRSIAFYKVLFGVEPAKCRPDYAKFELDDPPVVLSLEPSPHQGGGALNHVGFRMPDAASLVVMQQRLEAAGVRSKREEGVECCYAMQTKFWVHDPDKTLWEVYTLDADIEHRGSGQLPGTLEPAATRPEPVVWEHRLGEQVPREIPLAAGTADEVRLAGTFNLALAPQGQSRLVAEAFRVLKPGGRIFVHVLVGDRPLNEPPALPGPAAAVQHVPLQSEPVQLLEQAGFQAVRMLKFGAKPCFQRHGAAMRELQMEGWKKDNGGNGTVPVLYKGPLRQVADDAGTVYPRGEWVHVSRSAAEDLRQQEGAEQFVVME